MKYRLFLLMVLFLLNGTSFALEIHPAETMVLQFPDKSEGKWREFARHADNKSSMIEVIPVNQTNQTWSDLICIQYISKSNMEATSLKQMMNNICYTIESSCPESEVKWKIIEENEDSILYEWTLDDPINNCPFECEIARAVWTGKGFHRIGFNKRHRPITREERSKWIKLLKENVSILPASEANHVRGLSLVEKVKKSISLGGHFADWRVKYNKINDQGVSIFGYVPREQSDTDVLRESLDITTTSNIHGLSLNEQFQREKKAHRESADKILAFHVLDKSSNEITYTFSHPHEKHYLHMVVRSIVTDHACYSFCYRKIYKTKESLDEALATTKLKSIQIKNPHAFMPKVGF